MSDEITNSDTGGLAGVIRQGILNYVKDLHTVLPARVVTFYPATQTVDVQPQIQRLFKNTPEPQSLPIIINAPVWQPRAGGFAVTFPIQPGDDCLVLVSERSIDNWFRLGLERPPNDKRLHNLSDSIVLVGMAPEPRVIGTYDSTRLQVRNEAGGQAVSLSPNGDIEAKTGTTNIQMKASGDLTLDSPTQITLTAPEVVVNASTKHTITSPLAAMSADASVGTDLDVSNGITYGGNASGTGTSTAADHISSTISGNSHTHGGVQTGSGNTGGPQ